MLDVGPGCFYVGLLTVKVVLKGHQQSPSMYYICSCVIDVDIEVI